MTNYNIENTIRKHRFLASEMTQQELADQIGVTRQTVLAIESVKYSPTRELAFRIAQVFNVELGEIFKYRPNAI
ncbi:MAG: helix-turn-helix domain-containing protein [Candidatus Marinimicrobia bacterium]|nr:helix-turn-helix domain-containing protein [Candidatus Neomarinimicrobiota bacterium]